MAPTDNARQSTSLPLANVECLASHRARLLQTRHPVSGFCGDLANGQVNGQATDQAHEPASNAAGKDGCYNLPANVLVLEDRFPFFASIEVNDLHWVRAQFSSRTRDQLIASVKKILCQEFGRNRVKRDAFHFEICHGNIDQLIKRLVQVQFYTNQILLPEYNLLGERNELNGISITWGVGQSLSQAAKDRIRKRNQKFNRR